MIKNLTEDQKFLDVLLENREWQSFECKRTNIKPAKLLETVVAFLNTNGGTIVVGIEDPDKAPRDARLFGISENPDNISELMGLLAKELVPPMAIEVLALPIKNISKRTISSSCCASRKAMMFTHSKTAIRIFDMVGKIPK